MRRALVDAFVLVAALVMTGSARADILWNDAGPVIGVTCGAGVACGRTGSKGTISAAGDGGFAAQGATFITQSPSSYLSAEYPLSSQPTGIVINYSDGGTSVQGAYAGVTCDGGYFLSALDPVGFGTCTAAPSGGGGSAWTDTSINFTYQTSDTSPHVAYVLGLTNNTLTQITWVCLATQSPPGYPTPFDSFNGIHILSYTYPGFGNAVLQLESAQYAAGSGMGMSGNSISNGNVSFRVTGANTNIINWSCTLFIRTISA